VADEKPNQDRKPEGERTEQFGCREDHLENLPRVPKEEMDKQSRKWGWEQNWSKRVG
jgi:hypothetical protein